MCYTKPGPRCSPHTRKQLKATKAAFDAADADYNAKYQIFKEAKDEVSEAEFLASRKRLVAAREQFKIAKKAEEAAQEKRAVALTAYKKAREEYLTSPEGIAKLRKAGKDAQADNYQAIRNAQIASYKAEQAQKDAAKSQEPVTVTGTSKSRKYGADGFNAEGYTKTGFDRNGIHKDTGTRFGKTGYDASGFNMYGNDRQGYGRDGFNKFGNDRDGNNFDGFNTRGIHKLTGTKLDPKGYDRSGRDADGFNRDGFHITGRDRQGFNKQGMNREGYNRQGWSVGGWNADNVNKETGTKFNAQGWTRDHFNEQGFGRDGMDREGYNADGYNDQRRDRSGNLRPRPVATPENMKAHATKVREAQRKVSLLEAKVSRTKANLDARTGGVTDTAATNIPLSGSRGKTLDSDVRAAGDWGRAQDELKQWKEQLVILAEQEPIKK
jgi:hypothetical protein